MSELTSELQRVADDAARQARPPAAAEIIRQGDRRLRRSLTRRALGGLSAAGVVGAGVALSLGLAGSPSAHGTGAIRTTAFTLVKDADGTVTLTIHPGVLLELGTLQRDLQRDGIPAKVTNGSFCSSDPAPSGFRQVVNAVLPGLNGTPMTASPTLTINPAAMPAGTELSFGHFQLPSGQETVAGLIDTSSYTCTSTAPTGRPPRASAVEIRTTSGS